MARHQVARDKKDVFSTDKYWEIIEQIQKLSGSPPEGEVRRQCLERGARAMLLELLEIESKKGSIRKMALREDSVKQSLATLQQRYSIPDDDPDLANILTRLSD